MELSVAIHNRDTISLKLNEDGSLHWQARACLTCLRSLEDLKKNCTSIQDLEPYWNKRKCSSHGEYLLKELSLKALEKWNLPYKDKELCHCRAVDTDLVVSSIQLGAKDTNSVGKMCSAGTSCGTCTSDIQACIDYLS